MTGATILSRRPPRSTAKRRVQAKYPLAHCTFIGLIGTEGKHRARVRVGHKSFAGIAKSAHRAWLFLEITLKRERML